MPRTELSRMRALTRISSLMVSALLAVIPAMSVAAAQAAQAAPRIDSVWATAVTATHARLYVRARNVGNGVSVRYDYGTRPKQVTHGNSMLTSFADRFPREGPDAEFRVTVLRLRPHTTYYFIGHLYFPRGTGEESLREMLTSPMGTFTTK